MKKIDFYAGQPKSSKWVGVLIGSVFAFIAVVCAAMIVQLTRSPATAAAASVAKTAAAAGSPTVTPIVTPVAAPQAVPAPPAVATAAPEPVPSVTHPSSAAHHHKGSHHRHLRVASAKKTPTADAHAHAILAKHDSAAKRKSKDDLDRLLGL